MNKKIYLIGALVLILIAGAIYWSLRGGATTNKTEPLAGASEVTDPGATLSKSGISPQAFANTNISGKVKDNGQGVSGELLLGDQSIIVTDGQFAASDVAPGLYRVLFFDQNNQPEVLNQQYIQVISQDSFNLEIQY